MGNQDSAGVNNPSIIRAANGSLEFGGGTSWSGIGGTFASSMMIADNGNVGIGTASPIDRLDIAGGRIRFLGDYTTPTDGAGYLYKQSIGTTVSGYQAILETGPAGSRTSKLLVDFNGNVGIGTTMPSAKLDVAGTLKIADGTQ
jgi:hypothetical protein